MDMKTSMQNVSAALALIAAVACTSSQPRAKAKTDSAFASVQKRGAMAMGVDQYASKHTFDVTSDGGRIALQNDSDDSVAIAQIRAHMRLIQHAFAAGDFTTPAFVHGHDMPGTKTMAEKRSAITYTYADLPRGGEVRISTSDSAARKAIAEFLAAQRMEHHAGGAAGHSQ
jgi:hypothetical protein